MDEITKFTSHMCHELQLFVWEKPHSHLLIISTSVVEGISYLMKFARIHFSKLRAIPTSVQYVTLQRYFSHSSLVFFFFVILPIKLKYGQQTGGNYKYQISLSLWLATQKQGGAVKSYLVDSSLAGTGLCKLSKYAGEKPFSWAKPAHATFLPLIWMCRVSYWAQLGML